MTFNLFDGIKNDWSFGDSTGLRGYLNTVWQNRPLFFLEDEDEKMRRETEQKFFILENNYIHPKNYVGFVQYGDLRINVYPRVFYNHPFIDISQNPSLAISHVLKWLNYSSRIHFPFSELPLQLHSQDDWLEALIFLFGNYTLDILSNSPYFAYQEVTEEMAFVRGRIAMPLYISQNLGKGRHHLVHCTYEPFLYDNQFNRIVKYTCKILMATSVNEVNNRVLNDILFLLNEVSDIYCTAEDCAYVSINRLCPEVGVITNMCAAFLSNQIYSDGIGKSRNLCILLPIEIIYEQYVVGFIEKHFSELNARAQASDAYVALTGKNFARKVFRMKHDILLPDKMIIDTKYKFRYISDDWKGGVSQGDIYQMVTYCYKRFMNKGLLLYPAHFDKQANNSSNQFKVGSVKKDEIIIDASSIDITENEIANFEKNQIIKFKLFLQLNNN